MIPELFHIHCQCLHDKGIAVSEFVSSALCFQPRSVGAFDISGSSFRSDIDLLNSLHDCGSLFFLLVIGALSRHCSQVPSRIEPWA